MTDPLALHRAIQVGHVMNVIAELPRYVDDKTLQLGLRVAAVDTFFTHLRALIEFLTKTDPRAIQWRDYTTNFHLDQTLRSALLADYEFASQHVAHLNKVERVPTAVAPGVRTVDAGQLRSHADDAFAAMHAFVKHLKTTGSPYTAEFDRLLTEARSRQQ